MVAAPATTPWRKEVAAVAHSSGYSLSPSAWFLLLFGPWWMVEGHLYDLLTGLQILCSPCVYRIIHMSHMFCVPYVCPVCPVPCSLYVSHVSCVPYMCLCVVFSSVSHVSCVSCLFYCVLLCSLYMSCVSFVLHVCPVFPLCPLCPLCVSCVSCVPHACPVYILCAPPVPIQERLGLV